VTSAERRRRLRRGITLGIALVLLVGIAGGIGAWIAPTSPKTTATALVKHAVTASVNAGSMQYVELSTTNGVRDDISGSASPGSGVQTITETASSGLNIFDLRLVKGVVYFRGNKPAVVDQLGVPTTKASPDVNRWVSVRKGEKPYKTFAQGITTKSNISQLTSLFVARTSGLSSNAPSSDTVITGGLYNGKHRAPLGTARLTINTSSLLPKSFAAVAVAGNGARLTLSWTFTNWHERVSVKVPTGAVAYSSLATKSPSKQS